MTITQEAHIQAQKAALQAGLPVLQVVRPCRVGDGILTFTTEEQERLRNVAATFDQSIQFFIPASGSGS